MYGCVLCCIVMEWNAMQCNAVCMYVRTSVCVYMCYINIYICICNISIIFIQIMSFFSTHMHAYISHTNRMEDWKDKLMNSAKDVKSCGQYTC